MNEFFNSDFCFLLLNVLQKMLQPLPARFARRPNFLLSPPNITYHLLHRLAAPQVSLLQPLPACFARRPNLILFPPSMTYRLLHRLAAVNQGFQILPRKSIFFFHSHIFCDALRNRKLKSELKNSFSFIFQSNFSFKKWDFFTKIAHGKNR